jgi:hypothetical protein
MRSPRARGKANLVLKKLCARVLIGLVLLPFTAPFPAFDISDLGDHRAGGDAAVVCPMPAAAVAVDVVDSVVPPLLTKSGRLRIDLSPRCEHAIVALTPSPSSRRPLKVSWSCQSSLIALRL